MIFILTALLAHGADLVLRHGKIVTLDDAHPQVQAVAITNGDIVAAATDADVARQIQPSTKVIFEAGMLGDVTVLSKDILTIPEDDILKTDVEYTIVGGKIAYQRSK